MPILESINRQPALWNEDTARTTFENSPHVAADDILLRFGTTGNGAGDDLEAVDRPVMRQVRGAKELALNVMGLVGGSRLGRVVITRLAPGDRITPHADTLGKYADYYSRYHVVLQGMPGSIFTCGDETVSMLSGEIYWFDASAQHSS